MTIAFVNVAGGVGATLSVPGSCPVGALVVASVSASGAALTPPSGWTQIAGFSPSYAYNTSAGTQAASGVFCYVWTHVVASSDPASWTIPGAGASTTWVTDAFTGVSASQVTPCPTVASTTSSTVNSEGPVTAAVGDVLLYAWLWNSNDNNSGWWAQPPSSLANVYRLGASSATTGGVSTASAPVSAAGSQPVEQATIQGNGFYGSNAFLGGAVVRLLLNAPPFAPNLLSPAPGAYTDLSTPTFSWTYNPQGIGNSQTGYALRRKVGSGAYQWWRAGDTSWQAAETFNPSTASSVAFPSGAWSNGTTYQWSVANQDQGGTGPYYSDATVVGSATPTVTVTAPSGSSPTTSPTVTWTRMLQTGSSQTSYRVVVYSAAQMSANGFLVGSSAAAYDSGLTSGAATSVTTTPLPNGASYTAYVQISETGGQTSAWASSPFTVNVGAPNAPTLVLAYDVANARTVLSVTSGDASGTFAGVTTVSATRNGQPVRGATAVTLVPGTAVTVYDYEAPPGVTQVYAVTVSGLNQGYVVTSPQVSSTVLPMPASWWLKDPLSPVVNSRLEVAPGSSVKRSRAGSAVTALGRADAVWLGDGTAHRSGQVVLDTLLTEWAPVEVLLSSERTLLLQGVNPGESWYVRVADGDQVDTALAGVRTLTVPWVEVAGP